MAPYNPSTGLLAKVDQLSGANVDDANFVRGRLQWVPATLACCCYELAFTRHLLAGRIAEC